MQKADEQASWSYGYSAREQRAAFLETIADEIEGRAEAITTIGASETGLPEARLQGERGRTSRQLRLFARVTIWTSATSPPCLTATLHLVPTSD